MALIKCTECGKEISDKATTCPNCGAPIISTADSNREHSYNFEKAPKEKKKGSCLKTILIFFGVIIILGIVGSMLGGSKESSNSEAISDSAAVDDTVEEDNTIPSEYKSALIKANTYSDVMYMSKAAIYDQLTSEYGEKFSVEAAQYAIDNVNADWNENALKKAQTYQKSMSMSPEAIRDQLTSDYGEKFTAEEAAYAIDNLE